MDLLNEGRTIVVTINPSRSNSFPVSGNIILLDRRELLNLLRQPGAANTRIVQVFGFTIAWLLRCMPLRDDHSDVQTRVDLVLPLECLYCVGMLQNVVVYPDERDVFHRDRMIALTPSTYSFCNMRQTKYRSRECQVSHLPVRFDLGLFFRRMRSFS